VVVGLAPPHPPPFVPRKSLTYRDPFDWKLHAGSTLGHINNVKDSAGGGPLACFAAAPHCCSCVVRPVCTSIRAADRLMLHLETWIPISWGYPDFVLLNRDSGWTNLRV
jgi:hypothetical protein